MLWRVMEDGGIAPPFLTSAVVGGERSASRPGRCIPKQRAPRYTLDMGLGGLQNRSERYGQEKKSLMPLRESSPGRPARSLVAIPTELSRLLRSAKERTNTFIESYCMAVLTYGAETWTWGEAHVSRPTVTKIAVWGYVYGVVDMIACRAVTMQRKRCKQIYQSRS
jgi:hypothetical protein